MTPEQGKILSQQLADYVNAAIGGTPRLTLPSMQQFHGETSVMLHRKYFGYPLAPIIRPTLPTEG